MSTSQFFGLNIGYTGLQAANAALNVTGNNISNVDTKGYTRQEAMQQAADALRTNTSYGMAGSGVNVVSIDQVREKYYDLKYWQNNASLGIYEIKQQYYRQIEDYFTDKDDVKGFNAIYSDLFASLDEVYKSAGDDTKKTEFLSQCKSLTEYFNSMSTSLQKLQIDANDEIQNKVNEINSLAAEIATLNKQINTIEINGSRANELRDKRSLLIDQLSLVVDVQVTELPIYTTADGKEESGIYRYIVDIAGGQNLVNCYEYSTLSCVGRNADEKANQSDADGLYDIYINGLALNLYGGSLGGELKGLLEVRDGNNGEYFSEKGDNVSVNSAGDEVTVKIDKTNINYSFLTDMNKTTLCAGGTIVLGNVEFIYDSWEFDSATDTYTFKLKSGQDASSCDGMNATIGTGLDYQGIPYYQAQLNEWVRSFAQAVNKIEKQAQDVKGNPADVIFTCGSEYLKFNDYDYDTRCDAGGTTTNSLKNNYTQLTASNFGVSRDMIADVSLFGTTKDITQGQDAQDITLELEKIKDDKSKMTYRGCSSGEFLQCLTADVALGASSANNFQSNFDKISKAIANQRTSISGVDNDEEALNLVKFQEAYNLSSKMIQIMSEIYDQLILRTGV